MKVKITKPAEWYKDLIGKEFKVQKVTRNLGFTTMINYEVEDFREVYKELNGKYPEENEESHLIGLGIHLSDAKIIEQ